MISVSTILRNGERIIRMMPAIKSLLPNNNGSDSELSKLVKLVKQQDDAIYAKKNEICQLREKIEELEKYVWDLEQNVENCKYQINLLTKALTKEE